MEPKEKEKQNLTENRTKRNQRQKTKINCSNFTEICK